MSPEDLTKLLHDWHKMGDNGHSFKVETSDVDEEPRQTVGRKTTVLHCKDCGLYWPNCADSTFPPCPNTWTDNERMEWAAHRGNAMRRGEP